jgi:hypothetical protein
MKTKKPKKEKEKENPIPNPIPNPEPKKVDPDVIEKEKDERGKLVEEKTIVKK